MVGGFVQQQDVRFGQQQPGQGHPPAFAAGEHPHRHIRRRAAQGVHGQLKVVIQVPGIDFIERLLQPSLFGDQRVEVRLRFREFGVDLIEPLKQFHDRLDAFADHLDDRLFRVKLRFLFEQAHAIALAHADLANVVVILAGHDAQQGGLAGPVQAEHADLGAVIEAQRDIPQDLFVGGVDAPNPHHGVDDLRIGWHRRIGFLIEEF